MNQDIRDGAAGKLMEIIAGAGGPEGQAPPVTERGCAEAVERAYLAGAGDDEATAAAIAAALPVSGEDALAVVRGTRLWHEDGMGRVFLDARCTARELAGDIMARRGGTGAITVGGDSVSMQELYEDGAFIRDTIREDLLCQQACSLSRRRSGGMDRWTILVMPDRRSGGSSRKAGREGGARREDRPPVRQRKESARGTRAGLAGNA